MNHQNRRSFLEKASKAGAGLAVGAATLSARRHAQAAAASERLRLAVVGIKGRGNDLAKGFASRADCEIAYLCDVDQSLLPSRVSQVGEIQGQAPATLTDFRRALDDPSVDAIVVATPDHWHAPMTILACQAGKDVYVEKPVSHTPWEGRQMVEAARKYDRVIQVGTQNRSAPYNMAAKAYLDSGKLGRIHMAKVFNQKHVPNAKPVPDDNPPAGLDWDMWSGPAPLGPYNRNHHRLWRYFWRYSGGDITNDGTHQLDLARWFCGKTLPQTVYSTGGIFSEDGAFETPDTQVAVYQFDDLVMTFEQTLYTPYMLKSDPELRNSDILPHWPQSATRIEIYGTEGLMIVGRMGGGWQVFHRPKSRQPVVAEQMFGRFPDPEHKQNFVDCIRSRKSPNADIREGHLSTLLCQYANISYRLGGRQLVVDPQTETLVGDAEANALLKREYRAPWVVPEQV